MFVSRTSLFVQQGKEHLGRTAESGQWQQEVKETRNFQFVHFCSFCSSLHEEFVSNPFFVFCVFFVSFVSCLVSVMAQSQRCGEGIKKSFAPKKNGVAVYDSTIVEQMVREDVNGHLYNNDEGDEGDEQQQ